MTSFSTSKLNLALQRERTAVEVYDQALTSFSDDKNIDLLKAIQSDHLKRTNQLRRNIELRKEFPESSSGLMGAIARTVVGTAKILGSKATLKTLKEGEAFGLKKYQQLATDVDIDIAMKAYLTDKIIPKQQAHIRKLETLISQTLE